jgi:hypothetical protein
LADARLRDLKDPFGMYSRTTITMRLLLAFALVLLTGSAFAQTWGCYDACTPEYHHAPGYNYAPGCDYSPGYAYAPLSGY